MKLVRPIGELQEIFTPTFDSSRWMRVASSCELSSTAMHPSPSSTIKAASATRIDRVQLRLPMKLHGALVKITHTGVNASDVNLTSEPRRRASIHRLPPPSRYF
ncbi:hypothetical protein ACQ4PT_028676 [Festuca glaucescens]